ncbi:MAG TPA: pre-peptidase C-terminal domain-containing protein [Gemmatimonadales bacterium]|nr:pre-peptidase C-terminal domain-containing protein [Gemmatimonadales bacterium]
MRSVVLVLLALAGAAPALAQRPSTGSWRDEVRRLRDAPAGKRRLGSLVASRRPTSVRVASVAATTAESEPNDSVRTADSVALGDQATGVVNPAGDADIWFLDLIAGQFLSVDVDAAEVGSPLDPTLVLLAPDGRTVLASNDDFDGLDSRISYRVPTSGRYYVIISVFGRLAGSPELRYAINFGKVACVAIETEREPNDAPGTATRTAVGADASGEVCAADDNPAGDVDYWTFVGQAGTTIELDVDAAGLGRPVDPAIALYAPDGTTRLAFNDNADGADSRLRYSITATGIYFATVATITEPGGNPFPYILHIRSITPGPGDPTTVRADGIGLPLGLAVGSTGDLFVGDVTGDRVVRVSAQGVVTTFAEVPNPLGLAFDASGALLVASVDGAVYRVMPQGQATRYITDATIPFWIAVAPDGRIWLTDLSDRSLRRYSSTGQFEARFDATAVGGSGPGPLAIGPSGDPYFSQGTEIWRLVNGEFQRVFADAALIWAIAFDVAGNIYAPMPTAGRIKLFDPAGTPLADPFAVGVDAPQVVAFGRDETGATVARLVATDPQVGRVIEVNPAGVAHRGLPVGFTARFTPEVAATGLLGGGGLSAADQQFLDGLGNRNGRFDVGDFQAYLRTLNGLPGSAP